MKRFSTNTTAMPSGPVSKAFEEVSASFERFCLAAGVETLSAMLEKDAEEVCGLRQVAPIGTPNWSVLVSGTNRTSTASTRMPWFGERI
jgi:hypothetical protein